MPIRKTRSETVMIDRESMFRGKRAHIDILKITAIVIVCLFAVDITWETYCDYQL